MGKKGNLKSKELIAKKSEDFSEWFSEIIQKAELADIRYNVKGFLVHQPWSVFCMEKMYHHFEKVLQAKGHNPYFFPTVIPESNLTKESSHISGFTPEVFWVTQGGNKKLPEKLALRPTSETGFYQMFALWIRSYKDLPFKTYQRANIFRHDTKATRPYLRDREFYWIETHCAHETLKDAEKQVKEDMEMTEEILHGVFGLPFMFFERPTWDKFPGAARTFAADVLNPDGKLVQQPSTHMISQKFMEAFDVKYKTKDGKEKRPFVTCYGPAMSRILASVIIVHGDDKGLRFPWDIAPKQVVVVPVSDDKKLVDKANYLKKQIEEKWTVEVDLSERSAGEKFNYWEMKGVPVRIDVGLKDLAKGKITVFRRDIGKKELISENGLMKYIEKVSKECTNNLRKQADDLFKGKIKDVKNVKEMKKVIGDGGIARCGFCSVDEKGVKCAGIVEKDIGAEVRGTRLGEKTKAGKCVVCGKKGEHTVYIAKSY
jgi:prolyl-tRNA synthetase